MQKDQVNMSPQNQNKKIEQKLWTKLQKGCPIPDKSKVIISDYFYKQGKFFKQKRFFELYKDQIYYYSEKDLNQPKGVTDICFDLCFEILREKVQKKTQNLKQIGVMKGIQFDKGQSISQIFNQDEAILKKWRKALQNMLNQRGFHSQFEAQKQLGKGSFASVYEAQRYEDGKMYAIKAFSKEYSYNLQQGKEALINEINILRELNHPNIMKLHEVFETENSIYFVLDLMHGGELESIIDQTYKYNQKDIKNIMKSLFQAVQYIHEKNIMHRDLKPENILFKEQDLQQVIIVDFGLSTKANIEKYIYARCGTPGYVAPEIANLKDQNTLYSTLCDIYSLGIIFHILLLGKSPFQSNDKNQILQLNKKSEIQFDNQMYHKLQMDAFDLLQKMLQKDPQQRITAAECLKHQYFKQQNNKQLVADFIKNSKGVAGTSFSTQCSNSEFGVKNQYFEQDSKNEIRSKNSSCHTQNNQEQIFNNILSKDSCISFKMKNGTLNFAKNKNDKSINCSFAQGRHNASGNSSNIQDESSNGQIRVTTPSQFKSNRTKTTSFQTQCQNHHKQENKYKQVLMNNHLRNSPQIEKKDQQEIQNNIDQYFNQQSDEEENNIQIKCENSKHAENIKNKLKEICE